MWELDYKESWAPKNWSFWTVMLEKTLESPLDCKEIQPIHPKGDQSWIFNERTDAEAETQVLWPPDAKNWLMWKDPDAGKDWRQEEKGMTEDEMLGWHHWLNVHEFEWALGVGAGQGSLTCWSPWVTKSQTQPSHWTDWCEFVGFLGSSVGKESAYNAGDPNLIPGSGRSPGEGIGLPTPVFLGFPCGSAGKESASNVGDWASIPGFGRSPGEEKVYPLQYSGLENSMGCL